MSWFDFWLLAQNCELHSIATKFGSIAAQFRKSTDDKSGFAFLNCRVTGTGPLYVGRAMGKYARIVYSYTYFDNVVAHGAWDDWNTTSTKWVPNYIFYLLFNNPKVLLIFLTMVSVTRKILTCARRIILWTNYDSKFLTNSNTPLLCNDEKCVIVRVQDWVSRSVQVLGSRSRSLAWSGMCPGAWFRVGSSISEEELRQWKALDSALWCLSFAV